MTKKTLILLGFILLKFILQYTLISSSYDLQRDEYLHLDQAHHLAWGYVSVPPFTSWVSYIIYLLGNSFFWVKFFPGLFGALTIYIVWKTIEELNGNLFALILGATCVLFSAILRLNLLYQPNSFDVLSWTAFYFAVIKFIKTENKKWLFIGAVIFAAGFLNKYNIIFLLIGLLPALLLSKHRKVFAEPKFYAAFFAGLLIILPNILWQFNNHFPVVHHLKELAETQLVNVDRIEFLKSQLLFFIGSCVVIFSAFYALLFYKPFEKYKFFFFSILFTLTAFIYFKAKDYYAIGIYPVYISFGSVFIANKLKEGWKKYLQPVVLAIPLLLFIPLYKIGFPNRNPEYIIQHPKHYKEFGMLRWEDGKEHLLPQDFADMLGWKELARKVDLVYNKLPNNGHTLILCDNYGQAGAINYYTKNKKIKAVSFNADYINWFDLNLKIENFIRVKEFEGSKNELEKTKPFFETGIVADSITNPLAREYKTTIFSFSKPNIDIRQRLKMEIEKHKNKTAN